jgi:hypothetical protein
MRHRNLFNYYLMNYQKPQIKVFDMNKDLIVKLAHIANQLDTIGLYDHADYVTNILKFSAKKETNEELADKILNLLDKSEIKCPECGGEMDMEDGVCNCGDEDCNCMIDMKDEVDEFLSRLNIGNIDCPECQGTMELKGMKCICKNGKCKCKKDVQNFFMDNLKKDIESYVSFSNKRTAGKSEDHEFSMARKQLAAAHDAIEKIMDRLGTSDGEMMAWVQAYITMASDYLQSVANNAEFGDDFDLSDDDEDFGSVEELGPEDYENDDRFASAEKKTKKPLNKPFRTPGGPKKFSVYVKNKKGNIIKVNFGDPARSIKRDNPERRKNFRARHNCDSDPRAKDKTTAKYWSCKFWSNPSVTSLLKGK